MNITLNPIKRLPIVGTKAKFSSCTYHFPFNHPIIIKYKGEIMKLEFLN
jgi:hypothetical protein